MSTMKNLVIELSNLFRVSYNELCEKIIPQECRFCKSNKMTFYDYTDEEALWKCQECGKLTIIPYDFQDPDGQLHFYFS